VGGRKALMSGDDLPCQPKTGLERGKNPRGVAEGGVPTRKKSLRRAKAGGTISPKKRNEKAGIAAAPA